jgi:hypothetical protein
MRDLDNGRPIKDLDIFYNEDTVSDHALQGVLRDLGFVLENRCNGAYIDAASEILFTTVFFDARCNGEMPPRPDVNLINVAPDFDTTQMLARMDFGICLIGFNGHDVIRTAEYLKDQQQKTFTLTRADDVAGTVRSMKRYERLVQKYEGWSLVIPQELRAVAGKALLELGAPQ